VNESTDHPVESSLTRRQLLAAAGAGALSLPFLGAADALAAAKAPAPKRGGTLRVATSLGGDTTTTLNPHYSGLNYVRTHQLYEGLFDWTPDGKPMAVLADEISSNADATVWKITIKQGVEFHNGQPLTANDVVFSLQAAVDPTTPTYSASDLYFLTPSGIRALDSKTIELTPTAPIALITDKLTSRGATIGPAGYTNYATPVGTGPFMFSSFTPGSQSVFVRNPNWWQGGSTHKPYVDQLEIINVTDSTARLNALLSGQVDAADIIDYADITTLQRAGFKVLNARTGGFQTNYMCTRTAPYTDNRVRRGIRLLHDRKKMVDTIFYGHGFIGNDLAMPFDELYDQSIPQIAYDPEQALHLFKQAGLGSKPVLTLQTADYTPPMLESATILKQDAAANGITINLKIVPPSDYYTPSYLAFPFTQDLWAQRSLDLFILQALDSKAIYPETCWKVPAFDKLTRTGRATVNPTKRKDLFDQAQQMLWNEGGYCMWGHGNNIDGLSSHVYGMVPSSVLWLGWYNFSAAYLA